MASVSSSTAAVAWESPSEHAEQLVLNLSEPADAFEWYRVSAAVGNVRNQGAELISLAVRHSPGLGGTHAAREDARVKAEVENKPDLANRIAQFQFRDIRPKAASENNDLSAASVLLDHSKEGIAERVYRRVGASPSPPKAEFLELHAKSFGTFGFFDP